MYNEHGVYQEDEGDLAAPPRITSSKPRRTIPGTGASSDHDESSGTAKVPHAAATGRAKAETNRGQQISRRHPYTSLAASAAGFIRNRTAPSGGCLLIVEDLASIVRTPLPHFKTSHAYTEASTKPWG